MTLFRARCWNRIRKLRIARRNRIRKLRIARRNSIRPTVSEDGIRPTVSEDVVSTEILPRLHVKTLLRFRAVCKTWNGIIDSPLFVQQHRRQFYDPYFMAVTYLEKTPVRTISTFKLESNLFSLELPFKYKPYYPSPLLMGSINGLVCLVEEFDVKKDILLWNPATKLLKVVAPSRKEFGASESGLSIALGYNEKKKDYKVVVIYSNSDIAAGEVYSTNRNSWKTIHPYFRFLLRDNRSTTTLNGNPYWAAEVLDIKGGKRRGSSKFCIMWFDTRAMEFKTVFPEVEQYVIGRYPKLVNWNGKIGILTSSENSIHILAYDDPTGKWKLNLIGTVGAEMKDVRWMQYAKNGSIIGTTLNNRIVVLNPTTGASRVLKNRNHVFGFIEYAESMERIEGMKMVHGN